MKDYIPAKRKIGINQKVIESAIKEYNKDNPDNLKVPINQQGNFYENIVNTANKPF